jgi:hypothetical protein
VIIDAGLPDGSGVDLIVELTIGKSRDVVLVRPLIGREHKAIQGFSADGFEAETHQSISYFQSKYLNTCPRSPTQRRADSVRRRCCSTKLPLRDLAAAAVVALEDTAISTHFALFDAVSGWPRAVWTTPPLNPEMDGLAQLQSECGAMPSRPHRGHGKEHCAYCGTINGV